MQTETMEAGGYRYIPSVMQYSAGVCALDGYSIIRACFFDVIPMKEAFERIANHLRAIGRPREALCACELRSPGQFSESEFSSFNSRYAEVLRAWNIMEGDANPVARSNVCPEIGAPDEPGVHAFCYTVRGNTALNAFVIAGSGEAPEGAGHYRERAVRFGETDVDAIREKAAFVLKEMERRMAFFDGFWGKTTTAQVYCVHDIHPIMELELASRGVHRNGLSWHYCRPPVVGLEYEMDCRRVFQELTL